MHSTTWLDRETFTTIVDYLRARPSFHEAEAFEDDEVVDIKATQLPDLGEYVKGTASIALNSISVTFTGSLDACVRLFDLGLSGKVERTPLVSIEFEGVASSSPAVVEADGLDLSVSYSHHPARTLRTGLFVDAHTQLRIRPTSGAQEVRLSTLKALCPATGLGASVRIVMSEDGKGSLTAPDDGFVVLSRPQHDPELFLPVLREGKAALGFDAARMWLTVYRFEAAEELQERALDIVEALGRERIAEAEASYAVARADYDALRVETEDLEGKWSVLFRTQGGISVSELVDAPESLPEEMMGLEVGFDVTLPVVGETYVTVNAEREADGSFRYRLRFYRDYESDDERPDIREQRPSQTPEGRELLPYLEELEGKALDGLAPRDWAPPAEDLAIEALLRLWGDGRDLIDHQYEE